MPPLQLPLSYYVLLWVLVLYTAFHLFLDLISQLQAYPCRWPFPFSFLRPFRY